MRLGAVLPFAVLVAAFWLGPSVSAEDGKSFEAYEKSAQAFARGLVAAERGKSAEARQAYKEAVRLDKTFVEAMVNLARLQLETGDLAGAAKWLDQAARVRTDYPELHKVRALLALAEDKPHEAIVSLNKVRRAAPEDVEVLANLGAALLELGVLGEAKSVLEQALRLEPACGACVLNLALAEDRRGDFQRALFLYRHFLEGAGQDDADRPTVLRRIEQLEQTP